MTVRTSPVRLDAQLDGELSRGLWLVKWLLLVPHLVVLFFLWTAFWMLTVVVLFAILFTGRYPRSIFEFNLGVMRWTWRVWFYGYGGLGTDRYPPFSLGAEPGYPATLDVAYPEHLSRGLALVKWWLLAIPHYLVIAFFVGGGGFVLWQWRENGPGFDGGLVTLLSVFAGIALLFTGHYPRGIFDVVTGMNRWVLRVAAYATLMTDEYPPFRLDLGGPDPAAGSHTKEGVPEHPAAGWSAARVGGAVAGAVLLLTGLGGAAGGGGLLWLDGQRGSDGYAMTPVTRFDDSGYALRFDTDEVAPVDRDWPAVAGLLGDVRVRVSGVDSDTLFVGIARTTDVEHYLGASPYGQFHQDRGMAAGMGPMSGWTSMRPVQPAEVYIWDAAISGTGTLTLDWTPRPGNWSLVVMDGAARSGVTADVAFGATAPRLRPVAVGVLTGGLVLLVAGAVVTALVTRRRGDAMT